MTYRVYEQLLDRLTEGCPDAPTGRVDMHTLAKIVFSTYQQHQDDEWTSRALDLVDRLCLKGLSMPLASWANSNGSGLMGKLEPAEAAKSPLIRCRPRRRGSRASGRDVATSGRDG